MDLEGSGHDLNEIISLDLAGQTKKSHKKLGRNADDPAALKSGSSQI
jgi:hypothetical protein